MVTVGFRIYLDNGSALIEQDVPADPAAARALIGGEFDEAEGGLTIADEATGAEAQFGDTLSVLIAAFCLNGLETLKSSGRATVEFFDHEETAELVVADGKVTISGSRVAPQSFPTEAFFAAAAACGARYEALGKRIG